MKSLTEGQKQELIDEVIEQIKYDIEIGDVEALDELLKVIPNSNLAAYLPDIRMDFWNEVKEGDFTEDEVANFKYNWGQTHEEITSCLGYPKYESDDIIMLDYFWIEADQKWYNKCASMFTIREQEIADYLRLGA
jgi:hypothetical protein